KTPVSPEQRLASHQDGGPALANFVRSSNLTRTFTTHVSIFRKHRNLTTGTFNQVVKDRFAFPPERRVFSPAGSNEESSRPRNLLKISFRLRACQLPDFTGFPHFHAAKRIFLPAPAPNLDETHTFGTSRDGR